MLRILPVFRRYLVTSKWRADMSLASLTVSILDNVPLGTKLGWRAVLFLRIIEKIHSVIK